MKKRVLFVEDDPLHLQMYTMMLDGERERWEMATAADAREALEAMERAPFDVVVSDWLMPGMSGAELMVEVQKRHPQCSRIILSVMGDQEKVARCLESTHQFIPKPFDVRVLKGALDRICALDAYLQDPRLRALVGRMGSLPSFPTLYVEIMNKLGAADSSIESIAAVIARDPGMTAKMLQIVNSAVMGLARKVSSPFEAVEYLGLGTVRSLVLSAHIFSCYKSTPLKGFSVDQLWQHSIRTGMIARMIMQLEHADAIDAEDAYAAGMLHDVGQLLLANSLPERFERARALAAERRVFLAEAEQEVYGAAGTGVAAYLLGLWGLPAAIVEAVAFHRMPGRSEMQAFGPLTAVHAAAVIEAELSGADSCGRPDELNTAYLADVGVHPRLNAWREEAARLIHAQPTN